MLTFALLLSVPVALTGCGSLADDCDDDYEVCEDDDGGSGYYYGSKSKKSAFKGFGSGGTSSSGG
ncbi:hypothetical protein JW799_23130 [Cohnella algarum]|nr:hypothetical protein [Cohnella algarum]